MVALDYIRLAVLIVLVLPPVVLPWEGRRAPDAAYAAIALAGLAFAFARSGPAGAALALATGAACLALILSQVAALRFASGMQILTGGQIKLLSSAALYLGPVAACAMVLITGLMLFIMGAIYSISSKGRRPDANAIAVMAILCTGFGQIMMLVR